MSLSGQKRQRLTTSIDKHSIDVAATSNIAVAKDSSDVHSSENRTSQGDSNSEATAQLPIQIEPRYSNPNITDASFSVLWQMRDDVSRHASTQKAPPVDVSPSFEPFQPRRFLDTPPEIRLMIYEFVVGGNQRIYIKSNLEKPILSTESIIPNTIIRCSDHSSTGCLPIRPHGSPPDCPKTYCQGTASLSHTLRAPDYDNYQSTTVSYDLQTGKQQIATNNDSSNDQLAPCSERATYTDRMEGLRILRSCRQIYDEARLVLYNSNTFVFLGFATFATYFGLITPNEVYTSRSTEPNRLRGIQAMTKVGIHGRVGERRSIGYLKFSWASRLIRTGLGCLTSLTSLELNLKYFGSGDQLQYWNIDDCMFSKPSSLRKLVVSIETNLEEHKRRIDTQDRMRAILSKETLYVAEEIVWRILKQEGFHDKTERLLRFCKSGATTLLMRRQKV